ncbi:hypothetical protein [Actinomyces glycerinitolerans]|uniref:Uncharacterized protein n=1 Tax=Actinomyces glycerinitolerans TaxID=1892869 RepID=A0A1M4RZC3_9ACTO|nr:hypothetical protein [Actinomyces glycerinitolerans]SHE25281.1 Hypothetical protein ACGLYG10_1497 [Actinomyces glycerinitolerans]
MKSKYMYIAAVVLFVVGVAMIFVEHVGPEPDISCAGPDDPLSGYTFEVDGEECPISVEDFNAILEYDRSALPVRRAGLGIAIVGIGVGIGGIVVGRRQKRAARAAADAVPPRQYGA